MKLKVEYDNYRRTSYVRCPECNSKAYIDIEPFEGSYYWCKKCQKRVGEFMEIC